MEKPYLVQLIALRDRKISTGLLELFIVKADSDLISGFSRYSSSIGRLRLNSLPDLSLRWYEALCIPTPSGATPWYSMQCVGEYNGATP